MKGTFKLERIWRWRHSDDPQDSLLFFPDAEVIDAPIARVFDPDDAITRDDIEWLLLPAGRNFRLFVRGFIDIGNQIRVGNEIKTLYMDLLRYQPPDDLQVGNTKPGDSIWRLNQVQNLDLAPTNWRERAVLTMRKGDHAGEHGMQILCTPPFGPAGDFCTTRCNPPQDSKDIKLCLKRGCI